MTEKRLTRTERTYLRQHRKCVDPRYGRFKAVNNKPYFEYCTWFSLYCWYDKGIKYNRLSKEELDFVSQYKNCPHRISRTFHAHTRTHAQNLPRKEAKVSCLQGNLKVL